MNKNLIMDITPRPRRPERPLQRRPQPAHPSFQPPKKAAAGAYTSVEHKVSPTMKQHRFAKLRSGAVYGLLIVLGIAFGIASYDQQLGQLIIAVYAAVALILKIKSQYTFAAALFTLILVPLLTVIHKGDLANNYAVYSFLFLVVGVLSAALEVRRDNRTISFKR